MRHKVLFFPKPGYKCFAYGYGRGDREGQEERIRAYFALRQLAIDGLKSVHFAGMFMEPQSMKAIKAEFRQRPVGEKLIKRLLPGDHIIVDSLDRLGTYEVLLSLDRHFAERSICLHVVDFGGCSINFSTATGQLITNIHLAGTEYELALKVENRRVTQARARAKHRHAGTGVRFFCRVQRLPSGEKKLVFRDWAIGLMEQIVAWTDAGLGPVTIFKTIKSNQLEGCRRIRNYHYVGQLDMFYRAWTAAGRPEINSIDISKLLAEYEDKK